MEEIKLEHGSGGALSRQLTEEIIYPTLKNKNYVELSDATEVTVNGQIMFTTDTYTIDPPFFPGGDIGKLAVFGTCNDLSVSGSKPLYLSLAFVLEEGFSIENLKKILLSVKEASMEADVKIVTGDTKVVPKHKGGGIYINTSGIGRKEYSYSITPSRIEAEDTVIVSGPIGLHGIAVMSARESLPIGSQIKSDVSFLYPACKKLFSLGLNLKFMRDATRGGIASVLNEAVSGHDVSIELQEDTIPLGPNVDAISNILGLNPLEVANEGVFIAIVSKEEAAKAISLLKSEKLGRQAAIIGTVNRQFPGKVILKTGFGGKRILDFPRGLLLPRIC